jgi:hypothetical protein
MEMEGIAVGFAALDAVAALIMLSGIAARPGRAMGAICSKQPLGL